MNAPPGTPLEPRWTGRRWLTVIGIITVVQLLGVLLLSRSAQRAESAAGEPTRIRLTWGKSAELPALGMDPTLFALASEHGFSGGAWLRRAPSPTHQLSDWTEPPQWLTTAAGKFGREFEALARSNSIRQPTTRELPPPKAEAPEINRSPLPARSLVLLNAPLQPRGTVEPLTADAWIAGDVLQDTIVQVSVSPTGSVISTRLIQSSGLPAADRHALTVAARAQFNPLPAGNSQTIVGLITFRWSVTAAPPGSLINLAP
jgi:TonB family protein